MRKILQAFMDKYGDNPTKLAKKTTEGGKKGVSQSTIFRFMKGEVKFISPETVRALAEVYGINESQLRGDMPIDKELIDIETKVYRIDDPHKQEIIDKILDLERQSDIEYIEHTVDLVTQKKEVGGKMTRRKHDLDSSPIKERRHQEDRRNTFKLMVNSKYKYY